MYLIACGIVVGFVDHAGVYLLKLCPWCSLDLQDKIKQLPLLSLVAGNVFYFSSLGQQFGAVSAWEMFGIIFVVAIIIPVLLYTAFQKRKAADADAYLLMSEDNAPTPTNRKSHWPQFRDGQCHSSLGSKLNWNAKLARPISGGLHIPTFRACPLIHRCWIVHLHSHLLDYDGCGQSHNPAQVL